MRYAYCRKSVENAYVIYVHILASYRIKNESINHHLFHILNFHYYFLIESSKTVFKKAKYV